MVREKSNEYLFPLQNKHSKSKDLVIWKDLKDYLVSPRLSFREKRTLFKPKTNVVNVKNNYKTLHLHDMAYVHMVPSCRLGNACVCCKQRY